MIQYATFAQAVTLTVVLRGTVTVRSCCFGWLTIAPIMVATTATHLQRLRRIADCGLCAAATRKANYRT